MPEIWMNYGTTDVALDIRAENLEQKIDSGGTAMDDASIREKLTALDLSRPMELVALHNSRSVLKIITTLFNLCEQKSKPFPRVMADKTILAQMRAGLPEGCTVSQFEDGRLADSNLVFVAEMEFDGLFGYETISTRLIKRFGQESMLSAYAKRLGNLPSPGQYPASLEESKKFAGNFEIQGIEVVAGSEGILDVAVGHPSETLLAARVMERHSIRDVGAHRAVVVSTGKDASSHSLHRSLSSLWNCAGAVRKDGLAVLVAECKGGLGSAAAQQFVEGRLHVESLRTPAGYVGGMEDLLFLSEVKKKFQIALVSILPEFYTKKFDMISLSGMRNSLEYILKTQGARQKVAVVTDGARLLLR